ncbi:hypothetical protein [Nocardia bhagyanarayanae]|uniref:Uncharacterized protein n=1 Tax=Nocardia bhagyanarayanae TaxID=1215925 RepID=A0A543FI41_9NOCA|nr:hypothetical protein [Nocardia bhagyanarayanae]TQM33495.1 hypothetical protein FB390_5227 [Nocardia bhagyanarayanae]
MPTDHAATLARGSDLPASLNPPLIERLTARVTAGADAERVTTNTPYAAAARSRC